MDRPFGRYVLHERLGAGGMGEVYRATKRGPDGFEVQVALKHILPRLAREESFRRRFSREARLAGVLNHPNIVRVSGFDIHEEIPYIEMEYVEGADLRYLLRTLEGGGKLPLPESIAVLQAVARALEYAHNLGNHGEEKEGVIHCDLNPQNILISTQGEVKVADFGIARAILAEAAPSATVRGKLAYMSPEQMEGRDLDPRTDLFSLGIIAYQLLAGAHPFERNSEAATITAIGRGDHIPLSEAAPGLPKPLEELVERLLAPDPAARPVSAGSVLKVLEPLAQPSSYHAIAARVRPLAGKRGEEGGRGLPVTGTPPTLPRPGSPRLLPWILTAGIGGALLAFVLLTPPGGGRPKAVKPAGEGPVNSSEVVVPAAPPAPVPTPERIFTLVTDPPGGEILSHDGSLGKAPVEVFLASGKESPVFRARLAGYREKTFRLPENGGGRHTLRLDPLPTGTLRISAIPWARVTFPGRGEVETPAVLEGIPVGRYHVLLRNDPIGTLRRVPVEVREGTNTLNVDMREGEGQ